MKVRVAVVGKPRDAALAAAIHEYQQRATHYWPLDVVEVKEESARGKSPEQVMRKEAERLLDQVPTESQLVLCDPDGDAMDSRKFAGWLMKERDLGRDVSFVVGGAFGIGAAVRERPHRRLALAPWTLPHELARLVLTEQLYRAGTIVRGEPYHK